MLTIRYMMRITSWGLNLTNLQLIKAYRAPISTDRKLIIIKNTIMNRRLNNTDRCPGIAHRGLTIANRKLTRENRGLTITNQVLIPGRW